MTGQFYAPVARYKGNMIPGLYRSQVQMTDVSFGTRRFEPRNSFVCLFDFLVFLFVCFTSHLRLFHADFREFSPIPISFLKTVHDVSENLSSKISFTILQFYNGPKTCCFTISYIFIS